MLSALAVYPLALAFLQALEVVPHRTARAAVADLLAALLVGQSLRPSVLVRALPSPLARPARACYRQVARSWTCPWLTAAALTPALVQTALRLTGVSRPLLVLDSVRCGRWEVFTVGLRWHGRVLPVAWRVLPYPWPKGGFTPTVCALVRQVAAAWPAHAPQPHLVADRAFPSKPLLHTLDRAGWGWTIRLRASDMVTVGGHYQGVRPLLQQAVPEGWHTRPGGFGTLTTAIPTWVHIGQGLPVVRWHQRDAGSARAWARRRKRHLVDAKQQHHAAPTDPWVVLLSTEQGWRQAVGRYSGRYATEGTYRDLQTGWDGRHGWDLKEQVRRVPAGAEDTVEGIVALAALGVLLQSRVGDQTTAVQAPPEVQAAVANWTVHGRVSVWARGRFALTDPTGRLAPWVATTLAAAVTLLSAPAAPAVPPVRIRAVA